MDWVTHYGVSVGQEDGPPEVVQEYFGGQPWTRLEAYYRHSPRPYISQVKTPSLLLRGERDQDTMGEMHLALTELGVPNVFVTYPREPHSIGEPAHQRDLLERNLAWFKRWLLTR
jgi:dipeptidyl aminopeptidase/acylaminoacyl peptidase